MKYAPRNIMNNQKGMVAIMTTMILMIVVSLIVLGFSQIVRRNQRQALDAQLSSQAFYAAESGINLAKEAVASNAAYVKSSCAPDATISDYNITATNDVAVTCLLISPVNNLVFDNIGSTSKISLIQPTSGGVSSIFINWESVSPGNITGCTSNYPNLPQAGSWGCNQPLLRVDLVPLPGTLDMNTLKDSQYTAFFYPRTSGASATTWATSAGTARGSIIGTRCQNTPIATNGVHKCTIEISGLPGADRYGIRMMSLYGNARVETHVRDGAGVQPNLTGAQVVVDSTARAVDVLKRVQARVSMISNDSIPDFSVMSSNVCKRYIVDLSIGKIDIDSSPGGPQVAACAL